MPSLWFLPGPLLDRRLYEDRDLELFTLCCLCPVAPHGYTARVLRRVCTWGGSQERDAHAWARACPSAGWQGALFSCQERRQGCLLQGPCVSRWPRRLSPGCPCTESVHTSRLGMDRKLVSVTQNHQFSFGWRGASGGERPLGLMEP